MRAEAEIRAELASSRVQLDEIEGTGAAEEGFETGWVAALAWVAGGPKPYEA